MAPYERSLPEKLILKPHIFLEIGHSARSVAATGSLDFTGDSMYIGVELPTQNEVYAEVMWQGDLDVYREVVLDQRSTEDINFVETNGRNLDFLPDESVESVFMANVVDPPLRAKDASVFDECFLAIHRVLKPDGQVIVFEDRTPSPDVSKAELFQRLGFVIMDKIEFSTDDIKGRNAEFETLRLRYGMHVNYMIPMLGSGNIRTELLDLLTGGDLNRFVTHAMNRDYFMVLAKAS